MNVVPYSYLVTKSWCIECGIEKPHFTLWVIWHNVRLSQIIQVNFIVQLSLDTILTNAAHLIKIVHNKVVVCCKEMTITLWHSCNTSMCQYTYLLKVLRHIKYKGTTNY